MFQDGPYRKWFLLKYKEIQRNNREAVGDVQLVLDESRNRFGVFSRGVELEQVYYNMDVHKYPVLKFKEQNLYVMFNGQGQGFRLTFRAEDKTDFIEVMRRIAYISESPAKNRAITSSEKWSDNWSAKRKVPLSSSQPTSSEWSAPPAVKKSPARNLSASFTDPYHRSTPSPSSTFSQPSPVSWLVSSPESVSSSVGSALESISDHSGKFAEFPSSQSSSMSSFSSYSPHPFTPPPPIVYLNKCVQTEGDPIDQLTKDPEFMMKCIRKLMEKEKSEEVIKIIRTEIQKMPEEKKNRFEAMTDPSASTEPPIRQPPSVVHHPASDLDYDVFEDL